MKQETFADLGRIEAVRRLFEGSGFEPFGEPLSIEAGAGERVFSAAVSLLEGVDFNLVYFPLKHLGYKAVTAVSGELYAALARPATLSVVLGVSAKLDFEHIRELWSGVLTAAREHGYKAISLSLQPSRNGLCISVSATGAAPALKRPEAKSKDLICVSGSLGAAYLGLQVLERERLRFEQGAERSDALEKYKMLVGAYLKPEISPETAAQMVDAGLLPSCGVLVSKGLSDAVLRVCRISGLGAKIYADKIPFEGNTFDLGRELDIDPVSAAMNGGDDFRLLFTVPILKLEQFRRDFQTFDIIGHLALPEAGAVLVTPDGAELPMTAQGWN